MTAKVIPTIGAFVLVLIALLASSGAWNGALSLEQTASVARPVALPFQYRFAQDGILHEAGADDASSSPYWWLNSGGLLIIQGGEGKTIQGDIATSSKWYTLYRKNNPLDTDGGLHPQNIFRLVTRLAWEGNIRQEVYAKVTADQLSASPNRNASNGILLFSRYVDGNNLYYAGIRVDGTMVIKKKAQGAYTTLAQSKLFSGVYDRTTNPNLIPKNMWIGVRVETRTNADGSVSLALLVDKDRKGVWTNALSATDRNAPIVTPGKGGMRTDFMDVLFDDYRIEKI